MDKYHVAMFTLLTLGVCVQRITMAGSSIFLGICVALYLYCLHREKGRVIHNLLRKEVCWFLCIHLVFVCLLIPSLFGPGKFSREIREFLNISFYHVIPFLVIVSFVDKRKILLIMLGVFLLLEGIESGLAIWQTLVDYNGVGTRGNGFHSSGLFIPGMLSYVLPLCGFILLDEHFEKKLKLIVAIVFPFLIGAEFAAKSRAGFLIFVVMIPIVCWHYIAGNRHVRVISLIFIFLLMVGVFFSGGLRERLQSATDFTGYDKSNYARVLLWQSSLNMMKDHPVTGVGLRHWESAYREKYISKEIIEIGHKSLAHAHSNYMQIGGEAGWPGFIGIILFHFVVLATTLVGWIKNRDVYSGILFSMWLGEAVFGLIEPVFIQSDQSKIIMWLTGIIVGMKNLSNREKVE